MNNVIHISEGLRIVGNHFTENFRSDTLNPYSYIGAKGKNTLNIKKVLDDFGFKVYSSSYCDNYRDKVRLPIEEVQFVWDVAAWPKMHYDTKISIQKVSYPRDNKYKFLKAIGFNLSLQNNEIRKGIDDFKKDGYLIQALHDLDNAGIEVDHPIYYLSNSISLYGKKITQGKYGNVKLLLELEWKHSDKYC